MDEYRNDVVQTMIALDKGFPVIIYVGRNPTYTDYQEPWHEVRIAVESKYKNILYIHAMYTLIICEPPVRYVTLMDAGNPPFEIKIAIVIRDDYTCNNSDSIWLRRADHMFDVVDKKESTELPIKA